MKALRVTHRASAFAVLAGFLLTCGTTTNPAPAGAAVARPSPTARVLTPYQELVRSDWEPVAAAFAAATCALPAPAAGVVNPAPVLPIDTPTCRSQTSVERQAAEKMALDLHTANPPPALADAHAQLLIDLDTHVAALAGVIQAFDTGRAADYNPDQANATYDAARKDVAVIQR